MEKIIVKSSAFVNFGEIPVKYSCNGEGKMPQVSWRTKAVVQSYIVYILDETVGFVHFVMYNIPGAHNTLIDGVLGDNSAGYRGYYPICPKDGITHLYSINVIGINTVINIKNPTLYNILNSIKTNIVAEGKLSGYYSI